MSEFMSEGGSVYGVPPGADFVECLFLQLRHLAHGKPPEYMAAIDVLVPSRRMQRRLVSLFQREGDFLLPRVGLVGDVAHLLQDLPDLAPVTALRRTLELKPVVARLVELDARLSQSDVIDLTASLTDLLDEMHGEGVSFDALEALSPDDQSGHWQQSLSFLRAIRTYVEALESTFSDSEAIHRATVEALCYAWQVTPHQKPVIVAGSTGSRATTRMLMAAVAALPKGMVLLPGFDFDLPGDIWSRLASERRFEDHPQFRFAAFLNSLGLERGDVTEIGHPPDPQRNKLISLSLRPAPVTDQWLKEGPELGELPELTKDLSLIEARDPKDEATAIAFAIRGEIEAGGSVALIAPDATLARRVTAELSRWGIVPDDSNGTPLSLTPAGRFLRQTLRVASGQRDPVEVMALLKHPMTHSATERGEYMRLTQTFELFLRKKGIIEIDTACVEKFAAGITEGQDWSAWLISAISTSEAGTEPTLDGAFRHHMRVTESFAGTDGMNRVFEGDAGEKIRDLMQEFGAHSGDGRPFIFQDYVQLVERALSADTARAQKGVRPDVMIWGNLEARVQGADLVILGGLNEGTWPEEPKADPWLNRTMRRELGLLMPERQIGLAAHDFQQAVGAKRVILSRSARKEGSETVPSRWLSRLTNLLDGLKRNDGHVALKQIRERGNVFLGYTALLDQPAGKIEPEARPAPAPPVAARPRNFAVTEIQRLIRDPYAVYARRILKLKPVDPLIPEMDARRKGTVFHDILERFYDPDAVFDQFGDSYERLKDIAEDVLRAEVPDQTTRVTWSSQLNANAEWLFEQEIKRRQEGLPLLTEVKGEYTVPGTPFSLHGKADRIDRLGDGRLVIYDYKTGTPPSRADIRRYDRQLILEATMAENGAFEGLGPETVAHVVHIGVGRTSTEQVTQLEDDDETVTIPEKIALLLTAYLHPEMGYLSRRAMETLRYAGDYDHLARFGEWDESEAGKTEVIG